MNLLKNKSLSIAVLIITLIISGVFLWKSAIVKVPGTSENIPKPPGEEVLNIEGKIYSTPKGSQFDDYFISSNGQEYGIEAHTEHSSLKNNINVLRDSGKTIIIKGILLENIIDYGGRQIQAIQIQERKEEQAGLANPASVYCEKQGGTLEIRDIDKGQVGICVFNGSECEEWAYFRGECARDGENVVLNKCSEEDTSVNFCTEEYKPVCARIANEEGSPEWKTFSNDCFACISDEVIFGYKDGECGE